MVERRGFGLGAGGARAAADDGDFAGVGGATAGFAINAIALSTAVAWLFHVDAGIEARAGAVVAVDEKGALVDVRVAREHHVDAAGLEDRQEILPHIDEAALAVGIVRALRVGRMMEERDDPVARRRREIGLEPLGHGAVGRARRVLGVEAHEVNVRVVERVVRLGARGDAAGLAARGQREDVIVDAGLRDGIGAVTIVIAESGPKGRGAERLGIDLEERFLVIGVGAIRVGVVAEHEPQIGGAFSVEFVVGVAHGELAGALGAGIAEHPNTRRTGWPGGRRCDEGIHGGFERLAVAVGVLSGTADRVEVAGARLQAGELHDVLGGDAEGVGRGGERFLREPIADVGTLRRVGAPADDHARRGGELEIGTAQNGGGSGQQRGDEEKRGE